MIYNMENNLRDHTTNADTLIEMYLSNNLYIPCANPELVKMYRWGDKTGEEKKGLAFEKCIKQTIATYTKYYGKDFMKDRNISI
jgi:hypothetical protein